jgi:hypothetical protein
MKTIEKVFSFIFGIGGYDFELHRNYWIGTRRPNYVDRAVEPLVATNHRKWLATTQKYRPGIVWLEGGCGPDGTRNTWRFEDVHPELEPYIWHGKTGIDLDSEAFDAFEGYLPKKTSIKDGLGARGRTKITTGIKLLVLMMILGAQPVGEGENILCF